MVTYLLSELGEMLFVVVHIASSGVPKYIGGSRVNLCYKYNVNGHLKPLERVPTRLTANGTRFKSRTKTNRDALRPHIA